MNALKTNDFRTNRSAATGTGKTTLLRKSLALRLAETNGHDTDCVYIKNPRLAPNEMFEQLASGFKLSASAMVSKSRFLKLLEDALIARHAEGRTPVLIVDEAQGLSDELVEELRLLVTSSLMIRSCCRSCWADSPSWLIG